ncbi:hypothetical protein HanIR_Chr11g0554461 [Helianthus annuus]|nr:hypothetical protein HanIR_Chr11g0554461 [Helianthus annuus]
MDNAKRKSTRRLKHESGDFEFIREVNGPRVEQVGEYAVRNKITNHLFECRLKHHHATKHGSRDLLSGSRANGFHSDG